MFKQKGVINNKRLNKSKRKWGKRDEVHRVNNKRCQSFRPFNVFDNIVQILDPFGNFTSIRNTIGSVLKRVATGSVSKRNQSSLFAQLSKTLFENVNFDLIYPRFNVETLPNKTTRYGVHLPKEDLSSYFVG